MRFEGGESVGNRAEKSYWNELNKKLGQVNVPLNLNNCLKTVPTFINIHKSSYLNCTI